jgi:DNA mismatch repair protein MutS
VQPGVAQRAYGVEVAKLAQLPPKVLEEAERKLAQLESGAPLPREPSQQLLLFGPEEHPVVTKLRNLVPEELTPLKALELLFHLKKLAEGKQGGS